MKGPVVLFIGIVALMGLNIATPADAVTPLPAVDDAAGNARALLFAESEELRLIITHEPTEAGPTFSPTTNSPTAPITETQFRYSPIDFDDDDGDDDDDDDDDYQPGDYPTYPPPDYPTYSPTAPITDAPTYSPTAPITDAPTDAPTNLPEACPVTMNWKICLAARQQGNKCKMQSVKGKQSYQSCNNKCRKLKGKTKCKGGDWCKVKNDSSLDKGWKCKCKGRKCVPMAPSL